MPHGPGQTDWLLVSRRISVRSQRILSEQLFIQLLQIDRNQTASPKFVVQNGKDSRQNRRRSNPLRESAISSPVARADVWHSKLVQRGNRNSLGVKSPAFSHSILERERNEVVVAMMREAMSGHEERS